KTCRLHVAASAALLLAIAGWLGGQDSLCSRSSSGGREGTDRYCDVDFNSGVGCGPVHKSAASICFHCLQHWPVRISKTTPRLVGSGLLEWHSPKTRPLLALAARKSMSDPKQLTRELSTAPSATALLSVLEQELDNPIFNEVHIGAAFNKLAKLKHGITSSLGNSPQLCKLAARLRDMLLREALPARSCASLFWAIAKLQSGTPELQDLMPMLIENAKITAPYMNPLDVTNVVWACATNRLSSEQLNDLLPQILERLIDRADFLNAQQIANCIWASGKLKTDAPEMLIAIPVLLEVASIKILDFQGQNLANIIWSSGVLRQETPELQQLLPALVAQLPSRMGSMTNQEISNTAWGLALCGQKDDEFMLAAASRLVATASSMGKQKLLMDLPELTCAYAKLGMRCSALLEATALNLSPVLTSAGDWAVCSLKWSFGKLDPNRYFAEFQASLAKEVKRRKLSAEEVESSQLGPKDWSGANRSRTDRW
ncbi:unnamed protein product, partial [Polarella glacialis]